MPLPHMCARFAAVAKTVLDFVGQIIPFYGEASVGFVVWMAFFGGADVMYKNVLRPFLLEKEADIDKAVNAAEKKAAELASGKRD